MRTTILIAVFTACAFAQGPNRLMIDKLSAEAVGGSVLGEAVKDAPYSATIVTENIQTLADGNRISQKHEGLIARDSQGRMRHEAVLPAIGNMAADTMPKLVFINDPVAGATYTLNAGEKTYHKMPLPQNLAMESPQNVAADKKAFHEAAASAGTVSTGGTFNIQMHAPASLDAGPGIHVFTSHSIAANEATGKTESLGSKVIDGVAAEGTRTVRTIPAGEIGNDKPIDIVSESWFSNDLRTIVYSKRSDPRTGDSIFSLTNISRAEPDASLFAPPADYKPASATTGSRDVIFYKSHLE